MSRAARGASVSATAALALILALAAGLRLEGTQRWPMFLDEEDHVWVAAQIPQMPSLGAAAVWAAGETGKPPLLPVVLSALTSLPGGALTGGRVLSALAGTATVALCFLIGVRLRDRALGLQAAFLYAVCPWAVLHERLAIHDALLTLCMTATALLAWDAAGKATWRSAGVAAAAAVLSVQVKQSGILVVVVPVLALVLTRSFNRPAVARASLSVLAPLLSLVALSSGPFAGVNAVQSARWQPFSSVGSNLRGLLETSLVYLPLALGALMIGGLVLGLLDRRPFSIGLSLTLLAWALPWPIAGPFAPSRYYLPALPLACVLAPLPLQWWSERASRGAPLRIAGRFHVAAAGLLMASHSFALVVDPATARLPDLDAHQYQSGWPSGFGLREACESVFRRAEAGAQIVPVIHPRRRSVCASGGANPTREDLSVQPFPDFRTEVRLEPYSTARPVYFVVDDSSRGGVSARIMRADPRIGIDRTFPRPGGRTTVFVLKRPAVEDSLLNQSRGVARP